MVNEFCWLPIPQHTPFWGTTGERARPTDTTDTSPFVIQLDMNLIGGYQHHHHLMHEPFPFVQRCHQDAPYFQSWVVNHGEVPPDFQIDLKGRIQHPQPEAIKWCYTEMPDTPWKNQQLQQVPFQSLKM